MSVTALLPYYGGTGVAAHSIPHRRPAYLEACVNSLKPLAERVVIGALASDETLPPGYTTLLLDCEPHFIPAQLMRWAQQNVSSDYVYVTEADQVLHYDCGIFSLISGDRYLVPHRIEELGTGHPGNGGIVFQHDGRRWMFPNGDPQPGTCYQPRGTDAFGGGFLCTRDLFGKVNFVESADLPVEHSTGLDIAGTGLALKTGDWQRFYVEHLSAEGVYT